MDPRELSVDTLEGALRKALPPEHQGDVGALALVLAAAMRGDRAALVNPVLRPALRSLAGSEVRVGGALLNFRGA